MRKIEFRKEYLPQIGVGTWCIGNDKNKLKQEVECITTAINRYGMALIDTAQMYGDGLSEQVVGEVIKGIDRKKVFVVDKILPENAYKGNFEKQVIKSLELTNCEYFDLYLLHWREDTILQDVVDEMESLVKKGYIRHWGVSNFDVADMEDLFRCKNGANCYANQILYNIYSRGVEYDLLPWCKAHNVLPMIYSPMGNVREKQIELMENETLKDICDRNNITITNLMLKFVIRNENLITICKTSSIEHLEENLKDIDKKISDDDMKLIDSVYPSPTHKVALEKI